MVEITKPEPKRVTVVDYDIVLSCGKTLSCTLRADQGDELAFNAGGTMVFTFAKTRETVTYHKEHVAMISRREREMVLRVNAD